MYGDIGGWGVWAFSPNKTYYCKTRIPDTFDMTIMAQLRSEKMQAWMYDDIKGWGGRGFLY